MLLSEGQMSDHKGASLVLNALPAAKTLIADRGYDSKSFREALQAKGIEPCIPSTRSRKVPYPYDKRLYKKRRMVENLFANSRTGGASRRATTDVRIPSSQPYASPQPSSSGFDFHLLALT